MKIAVCFLCLCVAVNGAKLKMVATASGPLTVWIGGKQSNSVSSSGLPAEFKIKKSTRCVALKCEHDPASVTWTGFCLASLSNGIVTGNRWTCSPNFYSGWTNCAYDDNHWVTVLAEKNGDLLNEVSELYETQIDPDARFIAAVAWNSTSYCRLQLRDASNGQIKSFDKSSDDSSDDANSLSSS